MGTLEANGFINSIKLLAFIVALVVAFISVVFDCAVAVDTTMPDTIIKPDRAVASKAVDKIFVFLVFIHRII